MTRSLLAAPLALLLIVVGLDAQVAKTGQKADKSAQKADTKEPTLATAHGAVIKADGSNLTVRTRGADGRFGSELVLQVTGTSKLTVLSTRMQAGKPVMVQQAGEVKDLQPQQAVAVIYADAGAGAVLLTAVAMPK